MLEISNWKVYDLEESINACRYSMMENIPEHIDFNKSLERAIKLAKCPTNSGECNFLCGIRVAYDIKYPQYISPELQRYRFNDIVTSQSKMHRLINIDLDKSCNKYVSKEALDIIQKSINKFEYINKWYMEGDGHKQSFTLRNGEILVANNRQEALYYAWMNIISNCPLGLELTMRCTTNYLQLRTIYHQRKHHKLKEDWGAYCEWIKSLPYSKELITIE